MIQWKRLGVCPATGHIERIWHAGINSDGSRLFISSVEDEYLVWDIHTQNTIWNDHEQPDPGSLQCLDDWIIDGHISLESPSLSDRFRIFGLNHQHPLLESNGQTIETDEQNHNLIIRASANTQSLPFEAFSGDWAYASFSEIGNIIAVVEPYDVTLFGHADS